MSRHSGAKTKKAAAKRFKITATGKVMRRGAGKRHLLGNKTAKHKRRISRIQKVAESHQRKIKDTLPFSHRG